MGELNHRRKKGVGRMNQQVNFYSLAGVDDGQGGKTAESETSVLTDVWAELKEMTGYKRLLFNQLVAGKPFEIRIRKEDTEITESHIIGIDSRRLTIISVNEDFDHKGYYYIQAVEK